MRSYNTNNSYITPEPEYDYYEEDALPAGPTREPPLPSGPTRRPGQPMTGKPRSRHTLSPALNQFLNLPLLTTPRPRRVKPTKRIPKKKILEKLGPFQQHFIAPPVVNAGKICKKKGGGVRTKMKNKYDLRTHSK